MVQQLIQTPDFSKILSSPQCRNYFLSNQLILFCLFYTQKSEFFFFRSCIYITHSNITFNYDVEFSTFSLNFSKCKLIYLQQNLRINKKIKKWKNNNNKLPQLIFIFQKVFVDFSPQNCKILT